MAKTSSPMQNEPLRSQFPKDLVATALTPFAREQLEQSVGGRFEQQAHLYPARLAIKTPVLEITYCELDHDVNRVARAILSQCHVGREPVAILIENNPSAIVSILAVLKAGRIYVPLDLQLPSARLRSLLEDSEVKIILAQNTRVALAQFLIGDQGRVLNIDDLGPDVSAESPDVYVAATDPAHIVYTTGSTGMPKGVIETHRNILHHVMRVTNTAGYCTEDRMTLLRTPSSGGALMNVFSALLNGACLLPLNIQKEGINDLACWLTKERITVYHSSATVFRQFLQNLCGDEQFPYLRVIRLGSEQILKKDVELFKQHFHASGCKLVNALNCTEANTVRQYFIDRDAEIDGTTVPVGYPAEDMEILLFDESGDETRCGEIGEIAIRSRFLSPGYWKKPELTHAVFLDDGKSDSRIFLTGDMGRMHPDGCLEFIGRKDFQVKIRGYKVHTNEVEMALVGISGIEQAVVVAGDDENGNKRLAGYLVFCTGRHLTMSQIRNRLANELPSYMIPVIFLVLDKLPLTSNGKIDRGALPSLPQSRPELDRPFLAPRTAVEIVLARTWSEILNIHEVGVDDPFLELGGDSLLSSKILSRINRIFSLNLMPSVLFQAETVANLAEIVITKELDPKRADRAARGWLKLE